MTLLTTIAITGSIVGLGLGFVTLFGERGYRFDLRRRRARRRNDRAGGRRAADWARAAAK